MTTPYIKKLQKAAEQRRKIVQMHNSGTSVADIAAKMKISRQRVYEIINQERSK